MRFSRTAQAILKSAAVAVAFGLTFGGPAQALTITTLNDPLWQTLVSGGSSRVFGPGGELTLNTSYPYGYNMFGNFNHVGIPAGWSTGSAASGNELRFTASLSADARDWGAYLVDTDGYQAGFELAWTEPACNGIVSACYTAPIQSKLFFYISDGAGGSTTVSYDTIDLLVPHTYDFILKSGHVVYSVDGVQILSGGAMGGGGSYPGAIVIGDRSGSTQTGAGSMNFSSIYFSSQAELPATVPVPGGLGLLGLGLLGLGSVRRRKAA